MSDMEEFNLAVQLEDILLAKSSKRSLDECEVALHLFRLMIIALLMSDGFYEEELAEELQEMCVWYREEVRKSLN